MPNRFGTPGEIQEVVARGAIIWISSKIVLGFGEGPQTNGVGLAAHADPTWHSFVVEHALTSPQLEPGFARKRLTCSFPLAITLATSDVN